MWENLFISLNAVIPFVIYLIFGYGLRAAGLADRKLMGELNQLLFKGFFPILMFDNIYGNREHLGGGGRFVAISVVTLAVLLVLLVLFVPKFVKENSRRSVIIQALYRSNTLLFVLPLAESLFGSGSQALASMALAVLIPIYNVFATVLFEYYRGEKVSPGQLMISILKNPLIFGALVGFAFVLLEIRLPLCIETPVSKLASLCTPMCLLVLGGSLEFHSVRKNAGCLAVTLILKMIILPAVMAVVSVLFQMTPIERFIFLVTYAAPVATASYSMAQNMGGDGELAGELVAVSTVTSAFTIFGWIFVLKMMGLI